MVVLVVLVPILVLLDVVLAEPVPPDCWAWEGVGGSASNSPASTLAAAANRLRARLEVVWGMTLD